MMPHRRLPSRATADRTIGDPPANAPLGLIQRVMIRMTLVLTLGAALAACTLLTAVTWVPPQRAAHDQGLASWQARPFNSYRIALRIEALGKVCYQQIEVRGEWVRQTVANSCSSIWIDVLTVEQLFDLSEQISDLPMSRCGPPSRPCACHRVFTQRSVYYDETFGYPAAVMARSEVQFNWSSADFWRSIIEHGELPNCASQRRRLTVQVLALTPQT